MEAVIWLEDYLSRWNRILLLVSHSQDFLNNVCTHMIHFTNRRKLHYYDGNYDQFVKTKFEKEENQWKQYKWEQEQIKSMKEYIARFGHGTAKNAKQAQSKEKVLAKMIRAGLTEKPEEEKPLNFKFPDPGHLPPPVLAFHDVSFAYPACDPLYTNVNLGVDLDSRIALVGPNGAGKVRNRIEQSSPPPLFGSSASALFLFLLCWTYPRLSLFVFLIFLVGILACVVGLSLSFPRLLK